MLQMMGPIHPRSKRIVGRRMALAAADLVYQKHTLISNGPTLKNCSVEGNSVTINFDEARLKDDAVHVMESMLGGPTAGYDLPSSMVHTLCEISGINLAANSTHGATHSPFCSSFGALSPLEIRYEIPLPNKTNVSVWIPTSVTSSSTKKLNTNCVKCMSPGVPKGCGCVNYTRTAGWASALTHTTLPPNLQAMLAAVSPAQCTAGKDGAACTLGDFITGIRYAWSASPCCPTVDRNSYPCPPNSCPIRGWNSTLPANPFYADIVGGKCKCAPPTVCD